ncbi:MAG TPA: SDR family oxidoreductase [Bacteroidia bacterium]|nr:SDR family oxidoreductase [Bacteroidia bacterium]
MKNIVITGTSRGIGYELVKQFCKEDDYTIFALSRKGDQLNALVKECQSINSTCKVTPIVCDLSNDQSLEAGIKNILKTVSSIDLLVNNAGAILNKPFSAIKRAEMEYVYNVNVFSVMRLIQELLPYMVGKQRSHIVNISSIGGVQGSVKFAGLSTYSSSKAALVCFTECLAEELKEKNISINCLALGAVQTEMLEEAFPGYKAPVTPSEMAVFIMDFCLNAHKLMNGKIIPISLSTP